MGFISKLVTADEYSESREMAIEKGRDVSMIHRTYERLVINENVSLSIQASYTHYCSPRETLLDAEDYAEMELAIFKDKKFVKVDEVTDNQKLICKLNDHYEGTVYGYVPVELLEELYQDLITN